MPIVTGDTFDQPLIFNDADGGAIVSVRLTGPRVFASQFRRNMRLEVTPTDVAGIFEYDGPVPRKTRI